MMSNLIEVQTDVEIDLDDIKHQIKKHLSKVLEELYRLTWYSEANTK